MRAIKQITVDPCDGGVLIALCEDGTLWQKNPGNSTWYPIAGIPQEDTREAGGIKQEPPVIYRFWNGDFRRTGFRGLLRGDLYLTRDGSAVNTAGCDDKQSLRIIVERV